MYVYSMRDWLFLFYLYCFLGWIVESSWVSIRQRPLRWVNRGFLRGPFLPLYGSGAIMMLVASAPFQDNLLLTFLAGCVGATVLEYVTGVTMEALFKVRYWDYSGQPFNFQGHICLGCTIAWGFLTIGMTHIIHKPIESVMYSIPEAVLSVVVFIATIVIAADAALSFKTAMDLRDILVKMEALRGEMERLQRRLDVVIAVVTEEKEQIAEAAEMKLEEINENMERRLATLKKTIIDKPYMEKPSEYLETIKAEAAEIAEKFQIAKYRNMELKDVKDYFKRSMIMGNPSMSSEKFKKSFEEIKSAMSEKVKGLTESIQEDADEKEKSSKGR